MVKLFKQVSQVGTLCIWMISAGLTACNNDNDEIGAGRRSDQILLEACPPDYHEPIQKPVRGVAEKTAPIMITDQGTASMALTNRTGKIVQLNDIQIRVVGLLPNGVSLTVGKQNNISSGAVCKLSAIHTQPEMRSNEEIKLQVSVAGVDKMAHLPLSFRLVFESDGKFHTIDQEFIWKR